MNGQFGKKSNPYQTVPGAGQFGKKPKNPNIPAQYPKEEIVEELPETDDTSATIEEIESIEGALNETEEK